MLLQSSKVSLQASVIDIGCTKVSPVNMNIISGLNECATLLQWVRSAISTLRSKRNGLQEQKLQEDVLMQLQSDLQCLQDTLPATYDLIDRAEWRIHDRCVADLLSKLKDAMYDADDILDEFRWHELKVAIYGNVTQLAPFIEFFNSVTQGTFNRVTGIQKRLNNISNQLQAMGFHQETPRFDESLRPETTSFPTEAKIFGRDREIKELIRLLGVPPKSSKRTRSEVGAPTNSRYPSRRKTARAGDGSSTSNQVYTTFDNNEETAMGVQVLPIVGIGGVGKTTLAQKIFSHPQVKSHFDLIIWICVSDDFDVKRLTKKAIEEASGKAPMTDSLNSLQAQLADIFNKRRFLIVLDDMWGEEAALWKSFCAPFKNVRRGSMMLVTTRSQKVADIVGTMDSFPVEGLKDDVYWKFFKLCVFGSDSSNRNPELERIGKEILPKLRGSPLAAKTLGRLLGISRDTTHWNNILESELWEHDQEGTEILPALRLSYMYLPFHLKRCFSFCAVYPKDHNFEKTSLAEMWVAEGFVVPRGKIPLQDIGAQYFQDLVNRSFFQKVRGAYVIHDLMHDMAQFVSKDECFIVKNLSDIEKVPENVRHLSILAITKVNRDNLSSLVKCSKLRTLLCKKPLSSGILSSVMDDWFKELSCLRVVLCASTKAETLPESIGNLKHLRYLEISGSCPLKKLPLSFCILYNLQIFNARKCNLEELPRNLNKLINLQKFESHSTQMKVDAADCGEQIRFIKKCKIGTVHLTVYNLGAISKDRAMELELWTMEHLNSLTLRWSSSTCREHKGTEVFQALQPPPTIKSVHLYGYPGEYLPRCFGGRDGSEDTNGRVETIFGSLTELSIEGCENLSRLEEFLQPAYAPAIRKIEITDCTSIKSVAAEWSSLEELRLRGCQNITHLLAPSLKKLYLQKNCGTLGVNINYSSLTVFHLSCDHMATIELQKWSLPVLQELRIQQCGSLTFIGESEPMSTDLSLGCARARSRTVRFPLLMHLIIEFCDRLGSLDNLLTHECLPAIESITIFHCELLLSLPTERVGSFSSLKCVNISWCPRLHWQSGTVLPPSLQTLTLHSCGDLSAWSPSCLENLSSLESLVMVSCEGIVSIPGNLWSRNFTSLQKLRIYLCPDLVSIGGPEAIANINTLYIDCCPKLKEIKQPRGKLWL